MPNNSNLVDRARKYDSKVKTAREAEQRAMDTSDTAIQKKEQNKPVIVQALTFFATYGTLQDKGFGPKIFIESDKGFAAISQVNSTGHSGESNIKTANNTLKEFRRGKQKDMDVLASIPSGFACKREEFRNLCVEYGVILPESNAGIPEDLRIEINAAVARIKPSGAGSNLTK